MQAQITFFSYKKEELQEIYREFANSPDYQDYRSRAITGGIEHLVNQWSEECSTNSSKTLLLNEITRFFHEVLVNDVTHRTIRTPVSFHGCLLERYMITELLCIAETKGDRGLQEALHAARVHDYAVRLLHWIAPFKISYPRLQHNLFAPLTPQEMSRDPVSRDLRFADYLAILGNIKRVVVVERPPKKRYVRPLDDL